jgi:FkbM family methyltransferase
MRWLVGDGRRDDQVWALAGSRVVRGKWHGYRMILDLAEWSQRATYFLGRYYQAEVQVLLGELLRGGDRFVDAGANLGMLSLLASRLVGDRGRVDAIEPNPRCCDRIDAQLRLNRIANVRVHRVGLSDREVEADLRVVPNHSGFGTCAALNPDDQNTYSQWHRVELRRGDDLIRKCPQPVKVIKIDVEGFECHALSGMMETLQRDRPIVVGEVNPFCLGRAGTTPQALLALMEGAGYRALRLDAHPSRWGHHIALHAMDQAQPPQRTFDAVWFPAERPLPMFSSRVHVRAEVEGDGHAVGMPGDAMPNPRIANAA